jgi:hypothetical protein
MFFSYKKAPILSELPKSISEIQFVQFANWGAKDITSIFCYRDALFPTDAKSICGYEGVDLECHIRLKLVI